MGIIIFNLMEHPWKLSGSPCVAGLISYHFCLLKVTHISANVPKLVFYLNTNFLINSENYILPATLYSMDPDSDGQRRHQKNVELMFAE